MAMKARRCAESALPPSLRVSPLALAAFDVKGPGGSAFSYAPGWGSWSCKEAWVFVEGALAPSPG